MSSALGGGPCVGGHWSVARVGGPGRELVTSPWRWWCGVRVGVSRWLVLLQGGPRCPAWHPPSSRCRTGRCALGLEGSWCWCVPTALPRGSGPWLSCTAWRYAPAPKSTCGSLPGAAPSTPFLTQVASSAAFPTPCSISSPALVASWASLCQPIPGHRSQPLDPSPAPLAPQPSCCPRPAHSDPLPLGWMWSVPL